MTSVEPVVHADPTEPAIPSRSSDSATERRRRCRAAMIDRRPGQPLRRVAGELGAVDREDGLREPLALASRAARRSSGRSAHDRS